MKLLDIRDGLDRLESLHPVPSEAELRECPWSCKLRTVWALFAELQRPCARKLRRFVDEAVVMRKQACVDVSVICHEELRMVRIVHAAALPLHPPSRSGPHA